MPEIVRLQEDADRDRQTDRHKRRTVTLIQQLDKIIPTCNNDIWHSIKSFR